MAAPEVTVPPRGGHRPPERSLRVLLGDEHGLRLVRLKNYGLHLLHRLGLRRFRTRSVDLPGGMKILVREDSHDALIVREVWEEDMYPLGDLDLTEGDVVIDCGAQIGSFSLLAASRGARVLAFEPCPLNLERLRENVALNGLEERVEVTGAAVFRPGVASTELHLTYTNLGGHSLLGWIGPAVRVPCLSLAEIFERHGLERCRLLKLDVEGAECPILYTAGSELLARVERVYAEVIDHPAIEAFRQPGEAPHDHAGLMEFLAGEGFEVGYDATTKVVTGRRA